MKRTTHVLRCILTIFTMFFVMSSAEGMQNVQAQTEALDLQSIAGDQTGEKYSYNNYQRTLTLEDGFEIKLTEEESALLLKADVTIVLEGTATIESAGIGIFSLGGLTIKSAKDSDGNYKDGKLVIKAGKSNNPAVGDYCGILMKSATGNSGQICVTDNALVEISGGNYGLGHELAGDYYITATNKGAITITNGDNNIAKGYKITNKEGNALQDPIIVDANGSVSVMGTAQDKVIVSTASLKLYAFNNYEEETEKDGANFELNYDSEKHTIDINKCVLDKITFVPANFSYTETSGSEYVADASDYDYRDKSVTESITAYSTVAASDGGPVDAATYTVKYGESAISTFTIGKRKVVISGQAVRKLTD